MELQRFSNETEYNVHYRMILSTIFYFDPTIFIGARDFERG